jgi:hypothetical protein
MSSQGATMRPAVRQGRPRVTTAVAGAVAGGESRAWEGIDGVEAGKRLDRPLD